MPCPQYLADTLKNHRNSRRVAGIVPVAVAQIMTVTKKSSTFSFAPTAAKTPRNINMRIIITRLVLVPSLPPSKSVETQAATNTKTKRKRKRKKKKKKGPKKARSAFVFFGMEYRPKIRQENPGMFPRVHLICECQDLTGRYPFIFYMLHSA